MDSARPIPISFAPESSPTRGLPRASSPPLLDSHRPVLEALVEMARRYGSNPAFVRAGGGNASAKVDGVLYIKPSGVAMANLDVELLVPLDLAPLLDLVADPERASRTSDPVEAVAKEARLSEAAGRRPSVELLFHALLPDRFVLHTHPVVANALTCAVHGARHADRLFGADAVWVPYVDPGLPLALRIRDCRGAASERTDATHPPITFLQSHGTIVAAATTMEIDEYSQRTADVIRSEIGSAQDPDGDRRPPEPRRHELRSAIEAALAVLGAVRYDGSTEVVSLLATAAGRALVAGGPLTPDQIVYAGSSAALVDAGERRSAEAVARDAVQEVLDLEIRSGAPVRIVAVPGLGLFALHHTHGLAAIALDVFRDALLVAHGAVTFGGICPLDARERRFIETWEAEAYRQGVAANTAPAHSMGNAATSTGRCIARGTPG